MASGGADDGRSRLIEEEIEAKREDAERRLASGELRLAPRFEITNAIATALDDLTFAVSFGEDQRDAARTIQKLAGNILEQNLRRTKT